MEIFNSIMEFFEIETVDTLTNFGEFVPWFVKVILAILVVSVFLRCFFSAMVEVSRGIR